MTYEPVIGLEIHIELATKSKMFCACSADYFNREPNTHTCPVCLGLPGAMPVANKLAIKYTHLIGLALECELQLSSKFDRKNYFYPDLAKGFQISQYDLPFAQKGTVEITFGGQTKTIGVTRAHQEEDTGKLVHTTVDSKDVTLIDFNRSGVPLIEIVSEPDMNSSEEAKLYAQKIQQIVRYIGASDADMEKGSMRIEPNVSLRKERDRKLPPYKVELKNINSFKFAASAIEYEIKRQTAILDEGRIPLQETRGWNETKNQTVSQRSKEEAHDYRYFPEPDLPPFMFSDNYFAKLKKQLPELPDKKKMRFVNTYGLTYYDAEVLTQDKTLANFYEDAAIIYKKDNKTVANWVTGELLRRLNESKISIANTRILPAQLVELLLAVDEGKLTASSAKVVLAQTMTTGGSPSAIITKMNLTMLDDESLDKIVKKIVDLNDRAVEDYKAGKEGSISYLIGQVQKESKGTADAQKAREKIISIIKLVTN